jgi:hypothetical protein
MTHPTGWHTFGEGDLLCLSHSFSFVSVTVYTLFHQHDSGKWLRVLWFSGKLLVGGKQNAFFGTCVLLEETVLGTKRRRILPFLARMCWGRRRFREAPPTKKTATNTVTSKLRLPRAHKVKNQHLLLFLKALSEYGPCCCGASTWHPPGGALGTGSARHLRRRSCGGTFWAKPPVPVGPSDRRHHRRTFGRLG